MAVTKPYKITWFGDIMALSPVNSQGLARRLFRTHRYIHESSDAAATARTQSVPAQASRVRGASCWIGASTPAPGGIAKGPPDLVLRSEPGRAENSILVVYMAPSLRKVVGKGGGASPCTFSKGFSARKGDRHIRSSENFDGLVAAMAPCTPRVHMVSGSIISHTS